MLQSTVSKTLYMNEPYCAGLQYLCSPRLGLHWFTGLQHSPVGPGLLTGGVHTCHLYLQVPIVSDDVCQEAMTSLNITTSMLCAGGQGAGSCKVCPPSCRSC